MLEEPAKQVQRVAFSGLFFLKLYRSLKKYFRTEHQEMLKNVSSGHSAERLVGYYTPTRFASKNRLFLPQCEAFSAYFAGRHSIPDLHGTKLTEGERLVRHFVALHAF